MHLIKPTPDLDSSIKSLTDMLRNDTEEVEAGFVSFVLVFTGIVWFYISVLTNVIWWRYGSQIMK